MKKLTTVLAVATLTVSTPVMAEVNSIAISDSTNNELVFAVNDVENLQATLMTDEQMAETQGAVAPVVAYGVRIGVMGTIGAAGNAWNHYNNTGKFSWRAAGRGFVIGAVGGGASKYLGGKGW